MVISVIPYTAEEIKIEHVSASNIYSSFQIIQFLVWNKNDIHLGWAADINYYVKNISEMSLLD